MRICDRCTGNKPAAKTITEVGIKAAGQNEVLHQPKQAVDLCDGCFNAFRNMVQTFLIEKTPVATSPAKK